VFNINHEDQCVRLDVACEGWQESQEEKDRLACMVLCTQTSGCTRWTVDAGKRECLLLDCTEDAQQVDCQDCSSGTPCSKTSTPSKAPVTWRRELSTDVAKPTARRLQESFRQYDLEYTMFHERRDWSAETVRSMETQMEQYMQDILNELKTTHREVFEDVLDSMLVDGLTMTQAWLADELRFANVKHDSRIHNSPEFIQAVCQVIEQAIADYDGAILANMVYKPTCNEHIEMLSPYAGAQGRLYIPFQLKNFPCGQVQIFLDSQEGANQISASLSKSHIAAVRTLGNQQTTNSGDGGESSSGGSTAAIVGIVGGCVAFTAFAVAFLVHRKRKNDDQKLMNTLFDGTSGVGKEGRLATMPGVDQDL